MEITGTTYDNITTNGGGPRTDCDQVYQSIYLITPPENTDYNTLYVGAGPANIPTFPPNCKQYTVQLWGIFEGETSPIQPTPTPTPSVTPTSTIGGPTPTPSSTPYCSTCKTYDIIYTGISETGYSNVSIVNCENGGYQTFQAYQDLYYQVCSCVTPIVDVDTNVTEVGPCLPPTPTPTPTPSITPSATPNTYDIYNAVNCDNPVDTVKVAYSGFLAIGKVVRLQLIDGCYEITSGATGSYDDIVLSVHNSCETCPR